MYRIFVVEDDLTISSTIKKHIEGWGYEVKCAEDFKNVLGDFSEYDPHLVLMDVTLPFFNGYHYCSEMRNISKVPIIFISSASQNMNIIMAMNMGADDFIPKPFDLSVLAAKIQALIRRTYHFGLRSSVIEHRGAILNVSDASLTYQDSRIDLTKNDFRILQTLMESKGHVVSRDTLMEHLWATDSFIDENTLTVNVARLRKKLDAVGLEAFIVTKKGLGYIIE